MNKNIILLEPLKKEDKDTLFQWINNKDLVINNTAFRPVSELEHERWFETVSGKRDDQVIFRITEISSRKIIGVCQLKSIHKVNRNAELQIRIGDEKNHGKGFGTIAVKLLCDFGFKDLNLHRIYLHVWSDNERAIRVYGKAGFVKEGVMQEAAFIDGRWVDVVIMGMLKKS